MPLSKTTVPLRCGRCDNSIIDYRQNAGKSLHRAIGGIVDAAGRNSRFVPNPNQADSANRQVQSAKLDMEKTALNVAVYL